MCISISLGLVIRKLLGSFGGVMLSLFYLFFCSLNSCIISTFEEAITSSSLYWLALGEKDFHQSFWLGILGISQTLSIMYSLSGWSLWIVYAFSQSWKAKLGEPPTYFHKGSVLMCWRLSILSQFSIVEPSVCMCLFVVCKCFHVHIWLCGGLWPYELKYTWSLGAHEIVVGVLHGIHGCAS